MLSGYSAGGRVDYAGLKRDGALDGYLTWLEHTSEPSGRNDKMAFWINAYNAVTLDVVADAWPLASIMDLDGGKVWDTRKYTVAGRSVTLNDIEHKILRPLGDPRIHAAVNCASKGCPPLSSKAFSGPVLNAQLDAVSDRWARSNGLSIDRGSGSVALNQIFDWYGEDFVAVASTDVPGLDGKAEAAVVFLAQHAPEADAAYLLAGGYATTWAEYSWKVNAR